MFVPLSKEAIPKLHCPAGMRLSKRLLWQEPSFSASTSPCLVPSPFGSGSSLGVKGYGEGGSSVTVVDLLFYVAHKVGGGGCCVVGMESCFKWVPVCFDADWVWLGWGVRGDLGQGWWVLAKLLQLLNHCVLTSAARDTVCLTGIGVYIVETSQTWHTLCYSRIFKDMCFEDTPPLAYGQEYAALRKGLPETCKENQEQSTVVGCEVSWYAVSIIDCKLAMRTRTQVSILQKGVHACNHHRLPS
jgi:hypothetical protein